MDRDKIHGQGGYSKNEAGGPRDQREHSAVQHQPPLRGPDGGLHPGRQVFDVGSRVYLRRRVVHLSQGRRPAR